MEIENSFRVKVGCNVVTNLGDRVDNFYLPLKEKVAIIKEILYIMKTDSLKRRAIIWFVREKLCEKAINVNANDYFYVLKEKVILRHKKNSLTDKGIFASGTYLYRKEEFATCPKCSTFIAAYIYLPPVKYNPDGDEIQNEKNENIEVYKSRKRENCKYYDNNDDNKVLRVLREMLSSYSMCDILILEIRDNFYFTPKDGDIQMYSGTQFVFPNEFEMKDEYINDKKSIKMLNKQKIITCEMCGNLLALK